MGNLGTTDGERGETMNEATIRGIRLAADSMGFGDNEFCVTRDNRVLAFGLSRDQAREWAGSWLDARAELTSDVMRRRREELRRALDRREAAEIMR